MADQYDDVVNALNPEQPAIDQDPADAVVQAMAVQQVQGPISRTLLATQAGVIGGFLQDAPTMEAVEMQPDLRVVLDEVVMEKEAQYEQALRAALDGYLTTMYGPQQLEAAITGAQQIQEEKAKREQSPIKNEIHFAEMTAVEADKRQQQIMAQQQAWINEAAALTDDRQWWETALDVAGMLLPFGEAKDIADIDNMVRDNPALADIAGDDLERIAANFQSLPLERQREIWPHLKQAVIDATASSGLFMIDSESNLLKAQSYLLTLLGTGGVGELRAQQIADVALGAMDVPVNPIAAGTAIARLTGQASATTKVLAQGIMKKAAGDSVAQASPAHAAARAGDINSAARHTVSTLADPNIAAKMGTDSVDAALNAMPHPTKDWWNVSIADDALPGAVRTELNDAIQKAAGNARSLTDEYEFLRVGAITQASRKKFVESFTDTMNGKVKADYLAEKLEMDNLRILNEGPDGFTYQYTLQRKGDVAAGEKPRVQVKTGTIKMGIDKETGTFTATATDTVAQRGSGILSPAAYAVRTAEGDFNLAVKQQLQSSQVEAAVAQRVANMALEAFKPISGLRHLNARKRVDSVIAAGDEWVDPETGLTGKVFTPTELIAGVPDANGNLVKLTSPNEMEAYYKYRMFADAMHKVEDFTLKRELNLGGFKDVDLAPSLAAGTDADAWKKFQVFAKPFENKGAALASVREKIGQGMYDSKTGKTIEITEDMVRELYDQGDVLVRIRDKWNSRGNGDLDTKGEFVEYARVGREQLAEIGARRPVLPYKQGYAPKVNKGEYAVRMMVPTAGKNVTFPDRPQVVRLFNSLKDAKIFRNQLIEAERAKLGDRITAEQEAALQRMYPDPQSTGGMGMAERVEETAGRHGGLFQGTRSADEVLFGLEGKKAERVSPIDTLYRHTQHVGAFVAKNEQRISLEKRWLNTVREMFPEVRVMGFDRTVVPDTTPAGKMLNRMQNQIREWNSIPTQEETLFQAWVQQMHDWVLTGKRGLGLSSDSVTSLQYLKHTNPLTALKAANMHMLLGVMNPRQIFVQAAAAVVAATKHPGVAGRAFVDSFTFSMLDNIRNDTTLGKALKLLVRNAEIDQEIADAYLAWRKTGLYESMFNNADTAKMSTDGLGVVANSFRSASNLSMSVYRVGEGFNRRFSFLVEYTNWRRTTGKRTPDDDELFQILEETNKNMLELDQANRAWWQGGAGTGIIRQVIGVATQFLQVPAKTMELVLKSERRGGFTPAHKRRIVLGQLALFGAAGLPFGTTLVQTIAAGKEAVTGEPLVVDPELAEAINQGATGFVINTLLGAELDVASSVAPAAGAVDLVKDVILSDDPMYVRMLGASASTGSRVLDVVSTLSALAYVNRAGDVDMGVEEMRMALKSIAQIPSSSRNLLKRWIMANQNQILDRRGRPVVKGDFDSLTEFGAMLGFPTTYENEAFILAMTNQEWEEMAKERADWQVRMMHQAIYEMQMDPAKIRAYMRALQVVDETLPVWVWKKSYEQFEERIFGDKPESKLDEEVAKYLKRVAPDLIREGAVVDNKLGFKYSEQAITQPFRSRPIEE